MAVQGGLGIYVAMTGIYVAMTRVRIRVLSVLGFMWVSGNDRNGVVIIA